jgi:hypothetical protein
VLKNCTLLSQQAGSFHHAADVATWRRVSLPPERNSGEQVLEPVSVQGQAELTWYTRGARGWNHIEVFSQLLQGSFRGYKTASGLCF